jgi:hypothetical protein
MMNKTLQYLDLSDNSLLNVKDQKQKGEIAHLLLSKNSRWQPVVDFVKEVRDKRRSK